MVKKLVAITVAIVLTAIVFSAGCTSNIGNNASPSPSISPTATQDPNFVPKNTSGYLTYSNRSAGFTIQYPPSWQVQENPDGVAFHLITNLGTRSGEVANLLVGRPEYLGTTGTLSNYSDEKLSNYSDEKLSYGKGYTAFNLLNSSNSTLAGYPAKEHTITIVTPNGVPVKGLISVTIVNQGGYYGGYFLSYGASYDYYDANLKTAQNMIQSFNIVS
jgi:hypothetical protein